MQLDFECERVMWSYLELCHQILQSCTARLHRDIEEIVHKPVELMIRGKQRVKDVRLYWK